MAATPHLPHSLPSVSEYQGEDLHQELQNLGFLSCPNDLWLFFFFGSCFVLRWCWRKWVIMWEMYSCWLRKIYRRRFPSVSQRWAESGLFSQPQITCWCPRKSICYGDDDDDLRNFSNISKHSVNVQAQCHKLFFGSTYSVLHFGASNEASLATYYFQAFWPAHYSPTLWVWCINNKWSAWWL